MNELRSEVTAMNMQTVYNNGPDITFNATGADVDWTIPGGRYFSIIGPGGIGTDHVAFASFGSDFAVSVVSNTGAFQLVVGGTVAIESTGYSIGLTAAADFFANIQDDITLTSGMSGDGSVVLYCNGSGNVSADISGCNPPNGGVFGFYVSDGTDFFSVQHNGLNDCDVVANIHTSTWTIADNLTHSVSGTYILSTAGANIDIFGADEIGELVYMKQTPTVSTTNIVCVIECDGSNWAANSSVLMLISDDDSASNLLINDGSDNRLKIDRSGAISIYGSYSSDTIDFGIVGTSEAFGGFRYSEDDALLLLAGKSGYGNHNILITSYANAGKDHDHASNSTNPSLFVHSATDPDSDNTQWCSLYHDQTDALFSSGYGKLKFLPVAGSYTQVGAGAASETLNNNSLFVVDKLEIGGYTYFKDQAIFSASARFGDNFELRFGSGTDSHIEFNTSQTNDAMMIAVDNTSRSLLIVERADAGVDFGYANQTNPTLWIHSADHTDLTQWMNLAHNQTDAKIDWGAGTMDFAGGSATASTVTHDEYWEVKIGGVTKKIMLGN